MKHQFGNLLRTLSVQEVADWHQVVSFVSMDRGISEHLPLMLLRSDTHILLAESVNMSIDVGVGLYTKHQRLTIYDRQSSEKLRGSYGKGILTSCSDRGTFLSFILWTPADAEPSRRPAAIRAPFMIAMTLVLSLSK